MVWGEIIAGAYTTPAAVVAGWAGSSGDGSIMLNTTMPDVGCGYLAGEHWRTWDLSGLAVTL